MNLQTILRMKCCENALILTIMKLNYYPETDSLYIDLVSKPGVESREISVSDGVVLDYDAQGNLVGIDIDNAQKRLDL